MSDYLFSSNENSLEHSRLQLLEKAFDSQTKSLLTKAGIREGFNCLEVGPGAGSILRWMKEIVGTDGIVVGVDKNTHHIASLADQGIEIIEGLIQETSFEYKFDLIHARYVLIHNQNGLEMLKILRDMLIPGGVLVIEEADFTTSRWLDETYKTSGNKVNNACCTLFRKLGLNPAYGTEVIPDLHKAGLGIVAISPEMHLCMGGSDVARVMNESVATLRKEYVQTGQCTDNDIDQYLTGTEDSQSLQIYYTTVSTIARKK